MRNVRAVIAVAIAAGALIVPSSAAAQITSISIGQAQLGPEGASLTVPVTVQCEAGWNLAYGNVNVAQSSGHKLAQGNGFVSENYPGVPCDTPVTVTVTVTNTLVFAFKQGSAVANVNVTVFEPTTFNYSSQSISQEIRIVKK